MNEDQALPCHRALDAECFKQHPGPARQLFAIKLLRVLFPGQITRRLMKMLGINLIDILDQLEIPTEDLQAAQDFADQAQADADRLQDDADQALADAAEAQAEANRLQDIADNLQAQADRAAADAKAAADAAARDAQTAADQAQQDADQAIADAAEAQTDANQALADSQSADADAGIVEDQALAIQPTPDGVEGTGAAPLSYVEPWEPGPPSPPPSESPVSHVFTAFPRPADGHIRNGHSTWQLAHDDPNGDEIKSNEERSGVCVYSANYYPTYGMIRRTFLFFDLTLIPTESIIITVALGVHGYLYTSARVCLQLCSTVEPLAMADYSSFLFDAIGSKDWTTSWNTFYFPQAGLDFVKSHLGGIVPFCLREFDHDYLNVVQPGDSYAASGMYFANATDPDIRPRLLVTYS